MTLVNGEAGWRDGCHVLGATMNTDDVDRIPVAALAEFAPRTTG